ncbi:MAG: glycosyltransferase family 1 protein [Verrucomicrobia bacterium]|nr:glycosyltransferase family 1 protein [Verrucomicrobiota bacterium]MDA1085777.1 glycosyltransferase family 1 protein [Verrucomicrobiota bacterium]
MRIAIDARWIFKEISGIGAYTRELIGALIQADSSNEYVLYFESDAVRERTLSELQVEACDRITPRVLAHGVFDPRSQLKTPGILRRDGIDIYHSTNYMTPLFAFPRSAAGPMRCVVTMHDVIPLKFPHFAPNSRKNRIFPLYRALMSEVARRADIIIADSNSSRRDVIEHCRVPPDRERCVRTIYCGVAARFAPPASRPPPDPSRERRILYVGRADPYKNIGGLVRAFGQARRDGAPASRLVIAGSPDPRYPEAEQLARELKLEDSVEWTGYLSEEQLVTTYQQADLLVLPSRYEGFGLPVVEAMACGVPVICSDQGSLPEVAGDAAVQVHPDDTDRLAAEIKRVLCDDSVWRNMSAGGIEHAKRFTWQRTAQQTLAIYTELASHE